MNRIDTLARAAIPVLSCLLVIGSASAQKWSDEDLDDFGEWLDSELQQMTADMHKTLKRAGEITANGNQVLFLLDGKLGDVDAALKLYKRSDALLDDFLKKWRRTHFESSVSYVEFDTLRIMNARGLAHIAMAKKDWSTHAKYRREAIETAQNVLAKIAGSTASKTDLEIKNRMLRFESEAHLNLYYQYHVQGSQTQAQEQLTLARRTAPDAQSKTVIEQTVEALKRRQR